MRRKVHTIYAFHEDETQSMLDHLSKIGLDVSKCYVCGKTITKIERPPRGIREKYRAWRHNEKFYDWNISGISNKGVICEDISCFLKANEEMRLQNVKQA